MLSKWCLCACDSYLILVITFNFDGHLIFFFCPKSLLLVCCLFNSLGFVFNPKMWGKKVEDGVFVSMKTGKPISECWNGLEICQKASFLNKNFIFDANLRRKTTELWLSGFPICLVSCWTNKEITKGFLISLFHPKQSREINFFGMGWIGWNMTHISPKPVFGQPNRP